MSLRSPNPATPSTFSMDDLKQRLKKSEEKLKKNRIEARIEANNEREKELADFKLSIANRLAFN